MNNTVKILKKAIMPIFLFCFVLFLFNELLDILIYVKPTVEYKANNTYDETLVVVAKENFAPYSFIDEAGELSGYNIELVNLIANELEMNVDIQILPREKCIEKIKSGQADIICNADYSAEFTDISLLTAPTGRHRFVIYGLENYDTFHKLYEKKIGRIVTSPVNPNLHLQLGDNEIMEYHSYTDAFDAVMNGEIDYIVGAYSILNYMTHDTGYTKLKVINSIISTEAFAFGISNNNVQLQQKINQALTNLDNTPIYEELGDKWLGEYVESSTLDELLRKNVFNILVVYTVVLLFLYYFVLLPIYKNSRQDKATKLYDKVTTKKLIERKLSTSGTLMVIDANKFKSINDNYGHYVGDEVIKDIAHALKLLTRKSDIVGRVGGDEFVVYLPNMKFENDARRKAELFREEVSKYTAQNPKGVEADISIGVAINDTLQTYAELFAKADKALYEAKLHHTRIAVFEEVE